MKYLVLALAAAMLAGCQTVNSTWSNITSSGAPSERQAPPPAAPAPPPQTALASPKAPTTALTGQSASALQAMWGEPSLKRKDLGSELWQYAGKGCTMLVYLYPKGGVLTVSHAEASPGGSGEAAIADCAKAAGKPPIRPTS
jgi:hypothetical protein